MRFLRNISRFEKRLLFITIAVLVMLVAVRASAPRPVDWTVNYESDDSRPYGTRVLFETLPDVFPESDIESVSLAPYIHLRDETLTRTAYLFLTTEFAPDDAEARRLLDYASRGNTVWIAANEFGGKLRDTLNLKLETPFSLQSRFSVVRTDTAAYDTLYMPGLSQQPTVVGRTGTVSGSIERFDGDRSRVVSMHAPSLPFRPRSGTTIPPDSMAREPVIRATMIRLPWGDGEIIVSATPKLFTNVNTVQEPTRRAAFAHLSVISPETEIVFWDTRHKPLVSGAQTPLRFLLSDRMLRTALYISVFCLFLLLIVNTRRRQRPIPEIVPPSNETLNFVRTVGDLYHRQGRNHDLARRKLQYLASYLRLQLGLSVRLVAEKIDETAGEEAVETSWDRDELTQQLVSRSGVPREDVETLVDRIIHTRNAAMLSDAELRRLSDAIHTFYQKTDR